VGVARPRAPGRARGGGGGMFCVGSGISTVLDRATPSTYEVGRNHPR